MSVQRGYIDKAGGGGIVAPIPALGYHQLDIKHPPSDGQKYASINITDDNFLKILRLEGEGCPMHPIYHISICAQKFGVWLVSLSNFWIFLV